MATSYLSPGVFVEEVPSSSKPIAGVGTSTPGFIGLVPDKINLLAKGDPAADGTPTTKFVTYSQTIPSKTPKLITNWTQFTQAFGDFVGDAKGTAVDPKTTPVIDDGHRRLAQAVYGFFTNGGTGCYVARVLDTGAELDAALAAFATIDEIALVAAPGMVDDTVRDKLVAHCLSTGDRFAILDMANVTPDKAIAALPKTTDLGAVYYPWIKVFDPATKLLAPAGDGQIIVPPSGHVAGIYARVDGQRGVHKAPANEGVLGAVGVSQALSRADVETTGMNAKGLNCIRPLNGNLLVWGARTVGGDLNGGTKYVNVRRTLLFLRESIDEGTQWVVFEPNTSALWQKITRNVSAFLTNVWRSGALFGDTAAEAFYVKCDAETNPPEVRDAGQVITEVGVAIARPAEFVIFRLSQMSGGK